MKTSANLVESIFQTLRSENPAPKVELNYTNNFTFLIAVLLSAQATDKAVNKVTDHLFKVVKTPGDIVNMGLEKLREYVKSIGLYNMKSKNIMMLSKILIEQYRSEVPDTRDELEKLPGIGRKSANVILNTLFGQPYIAVDTHVLRVSNRLGISNSSNPRIVESDLMNLVSEKYHKNVSNWLVLHGRYTCLARSPRCSTCSLKVYCEYSYKN